MFVNTKNTYVFWSFLFDHPQEAICRTMVPLLTGVQLKSGPYFNISNLFTQLMGNT
jgi:hypothetical protein